MSTRCSISSSASGGILARFTAASTPARTSASISLRVMWTIEPSPIRVGTVESKPVTSLAVAVRARRV